jgi:CRISPR-associated protein Csx14
MVVSFFAPFFAPTIAEDAVSIPRNVPCVYIATLGGQPQIVTLALDALLEQGLTITDIIIIHLSTSNPRYRAALEQVERECSQGFYAGHPCRYRSVPVHQGGHIIHDLDNDSAASAAINTIHALIYELKQDNATIHLCVTGGRRLLGMLALATALLYFDQTDCIWHLYSTDSVRQHTSDGAIMHLPGHPDVGLVRIPVPPWGHYFPFLRLPPDTDASTVLALQTRIRDADEHAKCQQVYDKLTRRQREVLRAFADGLVPQEVSEHLCITLGTVSSHQTTIYQECRVAWNMPPDMAVRLDYRWLREKFAQFF